MDQQKGQLEVNSTTSLLLELELNRKLLHSFTMSVFKLPSIHELPTAPPDLQKEVLEALFEPSDEMYTNAAPLLSQQHPSYDALIDEVGELLRTLVTHQDASARAALLAILRSHPRLGAPKPQQLSELSRAEQANINRSAQQETAEQLAELNRVYEEKFGGLIYVYVTVGDGMRLRTRTPPPTAI